MTRDLHRLWAALLPLQLILFMGAIGLITGVSAALIILLLRGDLPGSQSLPTAAPPPQAVVYTGIAPTFTKEVQFWAADILRWAKQYGVDPNILATVVQIESCGHYLVNSPAGAQGLFQVMPFHFADGENMLDPDTNAKRGINYLIGGLELADGHIGLAMAGYNGGWGVIPRGWGRWATETRNYYIWGSGIYADALAGKRTEESASLQSWLRAGGQRLCDWAASILPTATPPGYVPPVFAPTLAPIPVETLLTDVPMPTATPAFVPPIITAPPSITPSF